MSSKVPSTPLLFFQPFNMVVFLSFYSPIVLCVVMLSLSFVFQNFKGFIFLGILLAVSIARNWFYALNGSPIMTPDGTICTSIQYSKYGNSTFSAFVFAFTIMYILFPMFVNGDFNFYVLAGLLTYFFVDILIKINRKCTIEMNELFLNALVGITSAAAFVWLMYTGGSSKFLFFNEMSSNKEVCSMPKKQTFKCQVYKDGTLVGSI
jgi:hypothetical protein